jgi:hypothetical protein
MPPIQNYVDAITESAAKYAKTVEAEMALEDNRINVKMAAIQRIMQSGDNPLTGKAHSFSSAEAMVNSDREYADYLGEVRKAAVARIVARGGHEAALAEARLAAGVEC